ncbi:CGNR zinc finger domain-containing protein, partial [Streptomyces calidiresistens]
PLHGEPLPLEFANTVHPVAGELLDCFRSPNHLAWWLYSCRKRLGTELPDAALTGIDHAELQCFVLLRDTVRRLLDARVNAGDPEPMDVATINLAAAPAPPHPVLHWPAGEAPRAVTPLPAAPLVSVRAEIAREVIRLLSGGTTVVPRACPAPGCVFFFDHSRSRRNWCSRGCGNRARAARHYARHRRGGPDHPEAHHREDRRRT